MNLKITVELDKETSQTLEVLANALVTLATAQSDIAGRYKSPRKATEGQESLSPTNNTTKDESKAETSPEKAPEAPKVEEKATQEPVKAEEPVETKAPETETKAEEKDDAPKYTKADIQKAVVTLAAKGKKAEVKEIVSKYATKVSDIPEDKYGEVMDSLNALLIDSYAAEL